MLLPPEGDGIFAARRLLLGALAWVVAVSRKMPANFSAGIFVSCLLQCVKQFGVDAAKSAVAHANDMVAGLGS